MSHVTDKRDTSYMDAYTPFLIAQRTSHYMNKSCRISMSHVTDKRDISHMDAYTPFLNAQNTRWHMGWL